MRKHIKTSVSAVFAIAIFALLSSCNSRHKSTDSINQKEVEKDLKEITSPIPIAFELTEMLSRIGASYILTLTNPTENATKYLTEKKQALNLGIYSADLCYTSTYRQQTEALKFMKTSKALIEELNITGALDSNIVEKIEKIGDDKEKLIKIISESFVNTYNFLQKNERGGISSIIMAGSWVEGLYIATHISEYTYNNTEMVKIVISQKKSLDKLMELLEKDIQNPDVKSVYEDLKPLKEIYDSIKESAATESQLNAIQNEVKKLRNKITA